MKFGIHIPPFGDFADPALLAQTAREAEEVGWDGFFLWDHIIFDPTFHPIVDTWVGLAAIALSTSRVRLGPLITPLARRRPWKVAREAVSADMLSRGRLVLGVGLGDPVQWDFGFFGEGEDARERARKLDEGLDILIGLWSGEPFAYEGTQYHLETVRFLPRPVQEPRIPIWVAGWWPNKAPLRRAARWDGVCPGRWEDGPLTPENWREILAYTAAHRQGSGPFDAVHTGGHTSGTSASEDAAMVEPYGDAGVTWWIEDISPWRYGLGWEKAWTSSATEQMRERIRLGPPRGP
jgi:alkanesulfonate monooxygenase SsuD/methylene tetrahydromethanopterin reductase-like flavin-dependent oxidoreductase (luciferase family)